MKQYLRRKTVKHWVKNCPNRLSSEMCRAIFLDDTVSNHVLLDGLYEAYDLYALEESFLKDLPPDAICLDVGANIGNHSVFFSERFSKVIAFEPNPRVALLLRANCFGRSVSIQECACGEKNGETTLYENDRNLGASGMNAADGLMHLIQVVRIDDVKEVSEANRVDFMKLDVEGFEASVLKGAQKTLKEHRPIIAFEKLPGDDLEVFDILTGSGYQEFFECVHLFPGLRRLGQRNLNKIVSGASAFGLGRHLRKKAFVRMKTDSGIFGTAPLVDPRKEYPLIVAK